MLEPLKIISHLQIGLEIALFSKSILSALHWFNENHAIMY